MRRTVSLAAAIPIPAALFTAAHAEAQVRVRYVPALGFTDASNKLTLNLPFRGTSTEFIRIFEFLWQLYLLAGESLDLTVLDLRVTASNGVVINPANRGS